jgi:hypothetical protein
MVWVRLFYLSGLESCRITNPCLRDDARDFYLFFTDFFPNFV